MTATQSFLHGFTVAMWFATAAVAVGLLVAIALARTGRRSASPAGAISPAPGPGPALLAGESALPPGPYRHETAHHGVAGSCVTTPRSPVHE